MGNFNWEIWAKKGIKKILLVAVLGGLAEASAYLGTEPVPTEYLWITVAGVAAIEWVLNAAKHSMIE